MPNNHELHAARRAASIITFGGEATRTDSSREGGSETAARTVVVLGAADLERFADPMEGSRTPSGANFIASFAC